MAGEAIALEHAGRSKAIGMSNVRVIFISTCNIPVIGRSVGLLNITSLGEVLVQI
jgi:hypothetical protein